MVLPGHHVRRALGNSSWLVLERLIFLVSAFLVGILLARYLGPEKLGALSYATAFVALLTGLTSLGFGGIVVQELLKHPEQQGETIGTVLTLKTAAAIAAFLLGNLIAHFLVLDSGHRLLIFLVSLSILFDFTSGIRLFFEAKLESWRVAATAMAGTIGGAVARLAAIWLQADLWVFALLVAVQAAVTALALSTVYVRSVRGQARFRFSADKARTLLRRSWPLIISVAAATVYLKIDQVMLGQMAGMSEVGTYAVAARISEIWYFLPTIIAASIFPRLLALRDSDMAAYQQRLQDGVRYLLWVSLAIAILMTFAGPYLIVLLYGEEFRLAGVILAIHIWACPAVFMGRVVEKWFLAEDLLKPLIARQLTGAAINILLNLALIPFWGGIGAAVATVISYTYAFYFSCYTNHRTAPAGRLMTRAIIWPFLRLRQKQRMA